MKSIGRKSKDDSLSNGSSKNIIPDELSKAINPNIHEKPEKQLI